MYGVLLGHWCTWKAVKWVYSLFHEVDMHFIEKTRFDPCISTAAAVNPSSTYHLPQSSVGKALFSFCREYRWELHWLYVKEYQTPVPNQAAVSCLQMQVNDPGKWENFGELRNLATLLTRVWETGANLWVESRADVWTYLTSKPNQARCNLSGPERRAP